MNYNKLFSKVFDYLDITQTEFIEEFNKVEGNFISQSKISKILNDKSSLTFDVVVFLVNNYGINIDYLMGKSENIKNSKSFLQKILSIFKK